MPSSHRPPVIPVGLDAYRMWERWPYLRVGARAYMRSTYDRSGGNEGADASHFLYQKADDFNVALDVHGPGVLYFVRTNHWHGSPWHYVVDGKDHVVRESSTATPDRPVENSVFLPERLFPKPLAYTWSTTKGADLNWVPMPFEKSLQLAYSRTHYGTGYYIYQQFVPGTPLSRPLRARDGRTAPGPEVLALIRRAGTDLAPRPDTPEGRRVGVSQEEGRLDLRENAAARVVELKGPSMLRALELSVPREHALEMRQARLRVTWDGQDLPAIDAPVPLFFGAGTLYNRDNREYLVRSFPMTVRFDRERVHLACYFPMPFFRSARIELVGPEVDVPGVRWSVRRQPFRDPQESVGYFHATYRDHFPGSVQRAFGFGGPEPGRDLTVLDTYDLKPPLGGGGPMCGHFVGMSWIFSHNAVLDTLEGDPRFFFDSMGGTTLAGGKHSSEMFVTPQAQGTGTEEWGGGGDYWGGRTMTLPFAGHPVGAPSQNAAQCDEDRIESAYRFLLADLMPFGQHVRIQLEHGGTDESNEVYETVAYWYGRPGAFLLQTDELKIGDEAGERAHGYSSPQASAPYEMTSRYEWGVDSLRGHAVYPATTDTGRTTTGASEFTLKLRPDNLGVMLRRKLDYGFPNQRAEVYVAEAGRKGKPRWRKAGVWYTAGSNTCVYSNPREELGAAQHVVQTSNRRFRDDEFLIPRDLTAGRRAIRVRVVFTPVRVPLFPGHPLPPLAWSEMRYQAWCFVYPPAPPL